MTALIKHFAVVADYNPVLALRSPPQPLPSITFVIRPVNFSAGATAAFAPGWISPGQAVSSPRSYLLRFGSLLSSNVTKLRPASGVFTAPSTTIDRALVGLP